VEIRIHVGEGEIVATGSERGNNAPSPTPQLHCWRETNKTRNAL